ncbi:MAG: sialate O-acetylesterase [Akkermansiaceae bacterium]|nr:sialate O-acetylesterase [Akkermansiaceae bacterium]
MSAPVLSPAPVLDEVTGPRAVARTTPLMITNKTTKTGWALAALAVTGFTFNVAAAAKPLKVYIPGVYYRLMVDHVKKVLADPKRVCPAYDAKEGYEIAGFVWFQGWNDMCDGHTYPDSNKPGGYAEYSRLMACFIRDVRKDLSAPKMPFVIGVIGVNGDKATGGLANLRPAMAAPAEVPEFKGNVFAVPTAPYWDQALGDIETKHGELNQMRWRLDSKDKNGPNQDGRMTKAEQEAYLKEYRAKLITPGEDALWNRGASNGGYHYLGCAKTLGLIGKAFAEALGKQQ